MSSVSTALLEQILQQVRPLIGQGKVASYIPALAEVSADYLAMAVCTADGRCYQAGDAQQRFSIQSISKVLSLTLAMMRYDEQAIWQRVDKEPSGQPFNSLLQLELEQGRPRNPFINAGALVICDMLQSRLSTPKQRMLQLVRQLAQSTAISYDDRVAQSELQHGDRNAAIAYLMRSFGNFDNDVLTVLPIYFHYCALQMNCVELARCFIYLANKGCTLQGKRLITEQQTRHINALMMTSGMYDGAGDFAYRVGMPGKSGVGGGIVAIIPGEMSIAVWSPELDRSGNSLAGTQALALLAQAIGRSIF